MTILKQIRQDRGMRLRELGLQARLSQGDLSKVERRVMLAYPSWQSSIAEATGVDEAVLFDPDGFARELEGCY